MLLEQFLFILSACAGKIQTGSQACSKARHKDQEWECEMHAVYLMNP